MKITYLWIVAFLMMGASSAFAQPSATEALQGCFKIVSADQLNSCLQAAKNALGNLPILGPGTLIDTMSDAAGNVADPNANGDQTSSPDDSGQNSSPADNQ
jgi:hypothetical protein